MKLPIRRVPGTTPPKFEYYQTITTPHGTVQAVKYTESVSAQLETALCDLIRIAEQLSAENERLKG